MSWISRKAGVLSALSFFYFVNYLDRIAISVAGPTIISSLDVTPAEFGIILSSFGLGYFLAQVPGGLAADRWGSRIVLILSPIFWAFFTGLTGLVTAVVAFVLVRFCFGFTEGMAQGPTYKAIADEFKSKERPRALSIVVSSATLAPAIAGVIAGYLIAEFGWRMMFLILAVPALLAAFISFLLVPAKPLHLQTASKQADRFPEETISFRQVLLQPSLWLLAVSQFGYNFATWGYSGWLPSYLAMARDIDLKSVGALSSIPYLCGFFGILAGGWLGSSFLHRYRPPMVAACYLLAGGALFVAYQADTLAVSLAGLSATSFFLYAGFGPKGSVMLDLAPDKFRASYVGVVSTVGQAAGVIAPAAIGLLVTATGTFAVGFGLMVGALCISALSILMLIPALLRRQQATSAAA